MKREHEIIDEDQQIRLLQHQILGNQTRMRHTKHPNFNIKLENGAPNPVRPTIIKQPQYSMANGRKKETVSESCLVVAHSLAWCLDSTDVVKFFRLLQSSSSLPPSNSVLECGRGVIIFIFLGRTSEIWIYFFQSDAVTSLNTPIASFHKVFAF